MLVVQVFIFKDGQFLGNEMATGDRIEVGRDPACEVHLEDESVSRKHCFLFEHDGRLAVQDAGSALGTKVNGEAAGTPRYVGSRDDVAIGRYTLKFKQMSASSPGVSAPAPGIGELPPTAHVDDLAAAMGGGPAGPGAEAPLGGDIQFPAGLAPTGDDDPTRVDPDPAIVNDLDSALDAAFPEAGKPTAVLGGPDPIALGVGPTMPEAPGPGQSAPQPLPAEAPFVEPGMTAAPPPTPGAQPGSVPSSQEQPATMLAEADTRLRLDAGALRQQALQQYPDVLGGGPSAAMPSGPTAAASDDGAMGSMPGTGEADELAAMVGLADDASSSPPHSDVAPMAAPDIEVPSVEWAPGAIDDEDEDEDEDPIPDWSIVEALVSAQDAPSEAKDDHTLVEVIHYRNDRILDHAELAEGERFDFGRRWTKQGLQEAGVGKTRPLVKHKRGGVAELIAGDDVTGMLLREGQQLDLRALPEAQGKGKVPLTLGDLASLELYGDRVFVRIGKAPAVKPTAEMIANDKRQRKLTATAFGIAIGIWLMIFALAWIAQYRALAETVVQLEDEGFAEVIEPELELEEPEPELEEPEMVEEAPKPEQKEAPKPDPEPQAKPDAPKKPGVLDALKNVPKQRAGNQSLSKAMSNIKGVRVPGASGFKVSSVVGKGPKGVSIGGPSGGVSSTSLNSILRKGGGTGNLASKKGRTVKGRVKTLKRMSKVKGQGQLSKEEIMKVINKHIGKIQYCYEKQLRLQPGLSGKVQLEWVIATNGKVTSVKSKGSTLRNAAAINCMTRQVKGWKFPKPRGNGTVIVKFPFVFNTL